MNQRFRPSLPDRAVVNDDGTITLRLRVPVVLHRMNGPARTVSQLVFRPIGARDIVAVQQARLPRCGPEALSRFTGVHRKTARRLLNLMCDEDGDDCGAVVALAFWNAKLGRPLATPVEGDT